MSVIEVSDLEAIGHGIERPEQVLVSRDGDVFASDKASAVAQVHRDGSLRRMGHAGGEPNGVALTVAQDSSAEVIQSVAMLVGTRPGTRTMAPKYGMADPTFQGINQPALKLAVRTWEPRASVNVNVTPGGEEYVTVGVINGASQ